MVVLEVYTQNIKIRYKNTLLSKAVFLSVLTKLFNIIVPFIIAYKTGGLWPKHIEFYEQPKINLLGDYLMVAITKNSHPIVCSTFPFHTAHVRDLDLCSLIKMREIDYDLDGKNERLDFRARINLVSNEITSINLILPILFQLEDECSLRMQSLISFQHYFSQRATSMDIMTDLSFFQSSGIHCSKLGVHNVYNEPVITNFDTSNEYELDSIYERYLERNITTHLTNQYTYIRNENKDSFNLKLSVQYPKVRVYYKPSLWRILKEMWIQYLAIFIIAKCLTSSINNYIFKRRLVLYYEDSPLKKTI